MLHKLPLEITEQTLFPVTLHFFLINTIIFINVTINMVIYLKKQLATNDLENHVKIYVESVISCLAKKINK